MDTVSRNNANAGEMPIIDRRVLGAEHDVIQKREFRMDEERAIDGRNYRDVEIQERERLFGLILKKNVVTVFRQKLSTEPVAVPTTRLKAREKGIPRACQNDAFV